MTGAWGPYLFSLALLIYSTIITFAFHSPSFRLPAHKAGRTNAYKKGEEDNRVEYHGDSNLTRVGYACWGATCLFLAIYSYIYPPLPSSLFDALSSSSSSSSSLATTSPRDLADHLNDSYLSFTSSPYTSSVVVYLMGQTILSLGHMNISKSFEMLQCFGQVWASLGYYLFFATYMCWLKRNEASCDAENLESEIDSTYSGKNVRVGDIFGDEDDNEERFGNCGTWHTSTLLVLVSLFLSSSLVLAKVYNYFPRTSVLHRSITEEGSRRKKRYSDFQISQKRVGVLMCSESELEDMCDRYYVPGSILCFSVFISMLVYHSPGVLAMSDDAIDGGAQEVLRETKFIALGTFAVCIHVHPRYPSAFSCLSHFWLRSCHTILIFLKYRVKLSL